MQTRRISSIKIGVRHRKDLGDLEKLAESLETVGLLHPIVIDAQNRLIAGQRRLEAAKLLKWKTVAVTVVDPEAVPEGLHPLGNRRHREEEKAHQRRLNGLRNQKVGVATTRAVK